jgi:radical SAM protein with 4Fe4S-binding SPASM domain
MTMSDVSPVGRPLANELSSEELRDLVLRPARQLGVVTVAWSGGEFLQRPDWLRLLRESRNLGLRSNVCTNAEDVTRKDLEAMKAVAGPHLTVSVGINAAPAPGDLRDADATKAFQVLEWCKELEIGRHVNTVLSKLTRQGFARFIELLKLEHVSYNRIPMVPRGSGRHWWGHPKLTTETLRTFFHPTLRSSVHGYVSYTPFFLSPDVYLRSAGGEPFNPPIGCWVGGWLAVNSEGGLSICPLLLDAVEAGNVRETPLAELAQESELFRQARNRSYLKGKCGRCRYRETCGGCRALAYYHTGDWLEQDPICWFEPLNERDVSEHEAETNRNFERYLAVARHGGLHSRGGG